MFTEQEPDLKKICQRSSFNGLLLLYAICISRRKPRAFNFKDLVEFVFKDAGKSFPYFHGFLVACNSVGLVETDLHRDIITVRYVPKGFEKMVVDSMIVKIGERDKTTADLFANAKKSVETFFE